MRLQCVVHNFQLKRSKVKVTQVKIMLCPFRGSLLNWPNHFICGIHTTQEGAMSHAPFSGRKVIGQGHTGRFKFWPCLLCGLVPIWIASYVAYIQHTRERCVACHIQDQRSNVTGVVSSFGPVRSVASSLFGWMTSYVAYLQHMSGQCDAHHFEDEKSKVKVTQAVRSFHLFRSLASFVFDRTTSYVAHIQHKRGWCVAHHFFVICPLCGSMPIWLAFGGWGMPQLLDP